MAKKGLFHLLLGLVRGTLSLSLVVALLEVLVSGPRQRLKNKGLIGLILAMALSLLLPYAAKFIYRAVGRPGRA